MPKSKDTPNTPISNQALDYASCNQEKIHLIASVQSHGVFCAVNAHDLRIQLMSENFNQIIGGSAQQVQDCIGKRLQEVLSADLFSEIQRRLKGGVLNEEASHAFEWEHPIGYDVYLYRIDGEGSDENLVGIEITPDQSSDSHQSVQSGEAQLSHYVHRLKEGTTIAELGKRACQTVRSLTGLERVMLYRFYPPSWHGEVIAEDRAVQVHSFLHHKFPASDIPQPARDLYLKNQVRFIHDVQESTTPIHPRVNPYSNSAVDLSNSRLRAVSPIHIEYLKNMGVETSFSVAITVDDKLWGLIACHSSKKIYISHKTRSICRTLADTIALTAPLMEKLQLELRENDFHQKLQELFRHLKSVQDPAAQLFREVDRVNDLFDAQGYAWVSKDRVLVAGSAPSTKNLQEIYQLVLARLTEEKKSVVAIDSLSELDPKWEGISKITSGVLACSLHELDESIFMVFRPELIKTVQWGGDPIKKIESRNYQGKINPRLSFESWTETVRNTSVHWHPHEIAGIDFFKTFVFDVVILKQQLIVELSARLLAKKN